MGAGKSSVGRALGLRLNWIFEDLDDRVVTNQGRSVAEIFRDSGESAFREAERSALRQVLDQLENGTYRVIALGGGAFSDSATAALLRSSGIPTVFLDAPVAELWQRCTRQAAEAGVERPLLQDVDQFRSLYKARRKHYMKASLKIGTARRTVDSIAAEIVERLKLHAAKNCLA